jgi:hypothetical protein
MNIEKMRRNRKKRHVQNLKRKNLGTTNLSDFDKEGQHRITKKVLQAMDRKCDTSDHSSVTLLVLMPRSVNQQGMDHSCGHGCGHSGGIILVADIVVLAAGLPLKRAMPIFIQSNLPHIILQFGADLDCPNCPSICCAVDLCTKLMTGNFHFFASVAKCFSHCVSKIFTPKEYAPIVLSEIVSSDAASITTELEVGFLFHLPHWTREGNSALPMIATGPNVLVNTIIRLPFMKATGMILDLIGKVVDCKYLDSPLFPVNFCRTSNHVPVMDEGDTLIHHAISYLQLIQEVENLERYYDAKVMAGSSGVAPKDLAIHFGTKLPVRVTAINNNSISTASPSTADMSTGWVPPSGMPEDSDDYTASVLGKDRLL